MALASTFSVSFAISILIVFVCARLPQMRGRRTDLYAKQASHVRPTPRIGGVAIFGAVWFGLLFVPEVVSETYLGFLLATSILFAVGLIEDLNGAISAKMRLFSAMGAALLVIMFSGVWLTRLDIPFLDPLLSLWVIGVPLTLVATAGVANGFNLIDGVNGLAAFASICAATAIYLIALRAGVTEMTVLVPLFAAAILGFACVNYPLGLIFLGDAGAYTIGFMLSWFGIALVVTAPEISAWAILLVMFWPIADTVYAMVRRSVKQVEAMQPDRLHMHQLAMRGLEVCILGSGRRLLANSLATVLLAPFILAPTIAGVIFWNKPLSAFLSVVLFAGLFVGTYALGPKLVRRLRRRTRIASVEQPGFVIAGE